VIAPLSWCRGEWVDYTFAANLQPCLEKVLRVPDASLALTSPGYYIEHGGQGPEGLYCPLLPGDTIIIEKPLSARGFCSD
jgi:hypothetical protein